MRSVQPTVVTCVPEVITENDDSQNPACESSYQHRRQVRDQSAAGADEGDEMEQKDPSSQGPHNERARWVRHEDVASLVPACSGARVCHEQGREESTGSADRSIKSAELVERCPLTTRRLVKRVHRRLQESEVADVRHETAKSRLA